MKTIFFTLTIIVVSSLSCSKLKKTEHPNFEGSILRFNLENPINNPTPLYLSKIGSRLEYVPLESKPECMLGNISKLKLTDSFIFVSDDKKLLKFTKDGKYIKQIGASGRGPGEYLIVWDFYIADQDSLIYILDNRQVIVFDHDGHYLRSFKLDFVTCQMALEDNNTFVFHDLNLSLKIVNPSFVPNFPDTTYSIHITDSTGTNLIKIKHPLRQGNEPYINSISSPLYGNNGYVTFLEIGIDTLYRFNKQKMEPYVVFILGERKMDPHLVDREYAQKNKDKYWIHSVIENSKYFFIDLPQGLANNTHHCFVDKQSGKVIFTQDLGFNNDLDNGPEFWPEEVYNDSILVSNTEAYKFLTITKSNNKIREIQQKLTETSNPVVILLY